MTDTKIVIPAKNDQICFNMRQTTGEIGDNHATLLGHSFTAAIIADAHPAFVKSIFDTLNKHYTRQTINGMNAEEAFKVKYQPR